MLAQLQAVNSSIVITPADAVRGAVLFGAGDAFAQAVERHMDRHSVVKRSLVQLDRLVKATVVGSVYGGAILPAVYQLAEGLLPGRTALNVVLIQDCYILWPAVDRRQLLQPGRTTPARPSSLRRASRAACAALRQLSTPHLRPRRARRPESVATVRPALLLLVSCHHI